MQPSILWVIPYGVRIPDGWAMPEHIGGRFVKGQGSVPQIQSPGNQAPMPVPDIELDPNELRYGSGYIFPFHFKHPVTGKPTNEAIRNAKLKPMDVNNVDL